MYSFKGKKYADISVNVTACQDPLLFPSHFFTFEALLVMHNGEPAVKRLLYYHGPEFYLDRIRLVASRSMNTNQVI